MVTIPEFRAPAQIPQLGRTSSSENDSNTSVGHFPNDHQPPEMMYPLQSFSSSSSPSTMTTAGSANNFYSLGHQLSSSSSSAARNFIPTVVDHQIGNGSRHDHLKRNFWRLPDRNVPIPMRPTKRSSALMPKDPTDANSYGPQPKIRLTEEKMLARLRNFHITSSASDSNVNPNWFFIQRPVEGFEDIENRMSDDEECDELFVDASSSNADDATNQDERGGTLAMSEYLKRILAEDRKRAAKILVDGVTSADGGAAMPIPAPAPNPCTDIVLWVPPEDFIKDIITQPSSPSTNAACGVQDWSDMPGASMDAGDPSAITPADSLSKSIIHPYQRRNARQYSKPIIDDLGGLMTRGDFVSGGSDENDNVVIENNSWAMDIDE